MVDILKEGLTGSLSSVYQIGIIVIPLMIIIEILKDLKILDKLSEYLKPITTFFGMSKESSFPLLIGLSIGISYGAGVIIQSSKEGKLKKNDLILIVTFLVSCHAIFEDTLVFVAIGANGYLLFLSRLITACIITYVIGKRLKSVKKEDNSIVLESVDK